MAPIGRVVLRLRGARVQSVQVFFMVIAVVS